MVNLVTTSQEEHDFTELTELLKGLHLEGNLVSFLQTINDAYSDTIKCDKLIVHYGREYIMEEILGLNFMITPFSFSSRTLMELKNSFKLH